MKKRKQQAAQELAEYFLQQAAKDCEEIATWSEERRFAAIEEADREGPPPELVEEFRRMMKVIEIALGNGKRRRKGT